MPFLGKDWRSSGEQWIRTEHGWERTRVLECILDNLNIGLSEEKVRRKKLSSKKAKKSSKRLDSVNDDDDENERMEEEDDDRMNSIGEEYEEEEEEEEEEESDEGWNYVYDELSLLSDDDDNDDDDNNDDKTTRFVRSSSTATRNSNSSSTKQAPVFFMRSRSVSQSTIKRQPHIIYSEVDAVNRENNAPKATISEVLNALDMPGAVKDIKRFNYVCRLVQIVINEKLNQLSGNAQRTLFMIVKHMLIQVIKSQENLNVMRKLLHDFKKKIQDSIYFYFYYIGSQKLCDRHLATITKWQEILENPSHHRKLKRLHSFRKSSSPVSSSLSDDSNNSNNNNEADNDENNKENKQQQQQQQQQRRMSSGSTSFESIPIDCKLEIMRRLNCGLDLVNLSKCNRNLNDLVSNELKIWKNLCQFHFQQASINSFVNRLQKKPSSCESSAASGESIASSVGSYSSSGAESNVENDLDWKQIYFRLKRRFGHREIYADMVHKCCHCKSLFWKEIGHPCVIKESLTYPDSLEFRSEPITPKKLIELLLK